MKSPTFPCPVCGQQHYAPGPDETWDCVACSGSKPPKHDGEVAASLGTDLAAWYYYQRDLYDQVTGQVEALEGEVAQSKKPGLVQRATLVRLKGRLRKVGQQLNTASYLQQVAMFAPKGSVVISIEGLTYHIQWGGGGQTPSIML